jgi:hypothetical protein
MPAGSACANRKAFESLASVAGDGGCWIPGAESGLHWRELLRAEREVSSRDSIERSGRMSCQAQHGFNHTALFKGSPEKFNSTLTPAGSRTKT